MRPRRLDSGSAALNEETAGRPRRLDSRSPGRNEDHSSVGGKAAEEEEEVSQSNVLLEHLVERWQRKEPVIDSKD